MTVHSRLVRTIATAGIVFGVSAGFATLASAGECPAGKMKDNARTSGETMPVGVTDTVIAAIDLSPKGGEFKDKQMRLRKLVIAPGGVVPWHDHKVRPANIYVLSGTIEEYRSSCEAAIVHKAGEVVAEFGAGFSHWWKNTGSEPVVLLSADIVDSPMQDDHMM
jgi:quercetin dioxygenase-like cupin family protein